ncbi:hypothetical protein FH972_020578 [Carpinus fangiana]|uniref:Protein GRIM REAPER-like n=1 Tax=Carpinus fangiana TaxID=176857 RepID=A0A5N6RTW0_9ROSI|nr:hypothetical protein FH972_020578 [Carpinus fangiana]
MASTLLKLTTTLLLLSLHSHLSFSSNDNEEYVVDSPLANLRSRSRFLATVVKEGARCNSITRNVCNGVSANKGASLLHCCKKHCRNVIGDKNNCGRLEGARCNSITRNVCNGVSANKGASLLHCCKKHCRNVIGDKNNCGRCGNKCKQGQRCRSGACINTAFNVNRYGKCNKKCAHGLRCEYGYCGYA